MGCGPSKDTNVATDNTVRSKSLLKKNSDEANNATSLPPPSAVATEDASTAVDEAEDQPTDVRGNGDVVEVKDAVLASALVAQEEEGGSIATGSPDRYFSSRKDEEAVEGVTASVGYFSPPPEIAEAVVEAVPVAIPEEEVEAEKKVSDGNGGEEIVSKQGLNAGESSSKDTGGPRERASWWKENKKRRKARGRWQQGRSERECFNGFSI